MSISVVPLPLTVLSENYHFQCRFPQAGNHSRSIVYLAGFGLVLFVPTPQLNKPAEPNIFSVGLSFLNLLYYQDYG